MEPPDAGNGKENKAGRRTGYSSQNPSPIRRAKKQDRPRKRISGGGTCFARRARMTAAVQD